MTDKIKEILLKTKEEVEKKKKEQNEKNIELAVNTIIEDLCNIYIKDSISNNLYIMLQYDISVPGADLNMNEDLAHGKTDKVNIIEIGLNGFEDEKYIPIAYDNLVNILKEYNIELKITDLGYKLEVIVRRKTIEELLDSVKTLKK